MSRKASLHIFIQHLAALASFWIKSNMMIKKVLRTVLNDWLSCWGKAMVETGLMANILECRQSRHLFWSLASQCLEECCSFRSSFWLTVLSVNNRFLTFATCTYRRSPSTHQPFSFIHEANTSKYRAAKGLNCGHQGMVDTRITAPIKCLIQNH